MPLTTEEANALLPSRATIEKPDPAKLNYFCIAPPKWGKTTFFCAIPDALLLAFEQGHAFQKAHKMVIDAWDKKIAEGDSAIWEEAGADGEGNGIFHGTMTKVVEVLEASDRFSFIIMDTADMAAKMCLDYYLRKHGWTHAQDGGDYGKGHDIAQNTPFRQMVGRLMRTGRGIAFITHTQVNKTDLGSKKETTLPGGVFKFLHTQADVIMHGRFGVRQKGKRYHDRIIKTQGDEHVLAGNRMKDVVVPNEYVMDSEDPWGQWCGFFTDPNTVATEEENLRIATSNAATDQSEVEAPAEPNGEVEPKPEKAKPKAKRK